MRAASKLLALLKRQQAKGRFFRKVAFCLEINKINIPIIYSVLPAKNKRDTQYDNCI
jgi:hypothetical protein